jgi:excisionase family DNA binding protein
MAMTKWITTAEAADIMGVTVSYVRQLARNDRIRARRWGRDWQIERRSAEAFERDSRGYPVGRPQTPKNKG